MVAIKWNLLLLLISPVITQDNIVLELQTVDLYVNFLLQYHSQWPFRRLTFVYSTVVNQDASNSKPEETRKFIADDEIKLIALDRMLGVAFSKRGISINSMHLPLPTGTIMQTRLNLNITSPPLITLVLFGTYAGGLDSYQSTFIRQVSEAGLMSGKKLNWIIMSTDLSFALNLDLGVRPDSHVLAVTILPSEKPPNIYGISIARWTGTKIDDDLRKDMGINTTDKIDHFDLSLGPEGILELNGMRLSVAVFEDYPFVYVDEEDKEIKGWCVDIWKEIEKQLKFSTTYYILPMATSAGLFRRAAEELWFGRADVVLGAFAMTENDAIEFSEPVALLSYRFYLQRATTSSSWKQYIQPFSSTMWLCVCGTLLINAIFMTATYLLGRHYGLEDMELPPIYNWRESLIVIFGSLLQQGPDYMPQSFGSSLILWSSYVFGLVVYTAYSAALISKLTVRFVDPPFQSLEGFIATTDYVLYLLADSSPHRLIQTAERGAWKDIRDRRPYLQLTTSAYHGANLAAVNSRVAYLEARERLNFYTQKSPLNCQLKQVPTNILNTAGRFIFQKNSPYKAAIDQQLLQMSTSGRLKRWREFWMGSVKDEPCPANSALPKFGLEQVILPFSILGAGLVISIILLGMEETFKKLFPHHHGHGHHDVSSLQQLAKQSAEKKKNKTKKSDDTKKVEPKFEFIR